jgi:hypothetical protein
MLSIKIKSATSFCTKFVLTCITNLVYLRMQWQLSFNQSFTLNLTKQEAENLNGILEAKTVYLTLICQSQTKSTVL